MTQKNSRCVIVVLIFFDLLNEVNFSERKRCKRYTKPNQLILFSVAQTDSNLDLVNECHHANVFLFQHASSDFGSQRFKKQLSPVFLETRRLV